jgi:hypothetical protein
MPESLPPAAAHGKAFARQRRGGRPPTEVRLPRLRSALRRRDVGEVGPPQAVKLQSTSTWFTGGGPGGAGGNGVNKGTNGIGTPSVIA